MDIMATQRLRKVMIVDKGGENNLLQCGKSDLNCTSIMGSHELKMVKVPL